MNMLIIRFDKNVNVDAARRRVPCLQQMGPVDRKKECQCCVITVPIFKICIGVKVTECALAREVQIHMASLEESQNDISLTDVT